MIADILEIVREAPAPLRAVALDRGELGRYREITEDLEASLQALGADGPFGDTFAQPTSTPLDVDRPVVFDVSSVDDADLQLQAAVQLVCWSYGSAAVACASTLADEGLRPQRHFLLVMDELWRMLRASAFMVDRVDALTRLNRQRGVGQIMITHTMNDLKLSTAEQSAKALGFVERSALVFLGGLAPAEMGNLGEVFALSAAEQSTITGWADDTGYTAEGEEAEPPGRGRFLLKRGKRPGIPFVVSLTRTELGVNDTNQRWSQRMNRRTDIARDPRDVV